MSVEKTRTESTPYETPPHSRDRSRVCVLADGRRCPYGVSRCALCALWTCRHCMSTCRHVASERSERAPRYVYTLCMHVNIVDVDVYIVYTLTCRHHDVYMSTGRHDTRASVASERYVTYTCRHCRLHVIMSCTTCTTCRHMWTCRHDTFFRRFLTPRTFLRRRKKVEKFVFLSIFVDM